MKPRISIFIILFFLVVNLAAAKSGSMKLLAVSNADTDPKGSTADLFLEIKEGTGRVFIDSFPLSKIDTQISTRFAKEVACNFLEIDCSRYDFFYTIRSGSAIIGGPSAGAAITVLTISVLDDIPLDESTTITGTINTGGIIGPVGGIMSKTEAASSAGIKKILIPKYSELNNSNFTEYEQKYGIKVIEVSRLTEALEEMTGKQFKEETEVSTSDFYIEAMSNISGDMCTRAEMLVEEAYSDEENITARTLLDKGHESLSKKEYYSAASYCFGSTLNSQNKLLQDSKMSEESIIQKINETRIRIEDFREYASRQRLNTITDLETYMIVNDRLTEAEDRLDDAMLFLTENTTNETISSLAYGIERLNSAYAWALFFGKPGSKYNLGKEALDESCIKKISEVEERIEYLDLYLPSGTADLRESVKRAYQDYNSGNPALCLYKASIAKARVDLVLNTMAIDPERIGEVIIDRSSMVRSIIAKQNKRGVFPIMAYSYYEYANSLSQTDEYSALLYLGYALELGNLDIYFEKKEIRLPRINSSYILVFLAGILIGVLITIIAIKSKNKRKTHKK